MKYWKPCFKIFIVKIYYNWYNFTFSQKKLKKIHFAWRFIFYCILTEFLKVTPQNINFQMFLVELLHIRNHKWKRGNIKKSAVFNQHLAWNFYHLMCLFIFGAGVTHLLTNIPKYSIGRLRPHFIDVCKPNWSLVNDTSKFITEDICTGEKAVIEEARYLNNCTHLV